MKKKKLLGIIGHPVAHSLSPLMHNRAAELIGLDCLYAAFDVAPQNLKEALTGMRGLGIDGLNVTVPHKEKVIPFLDRLDDEAALIGAVNTITLKDGRLLGGNTDGKGFIRALGKKGFRPRGKSAAIIGAGGSARAIGVALCRAGVSKLVVINRSATRGRRLARILSKLGDVSFAASDKSYAARVAEAADIIVQTTPCGMKRSDPLPVSGIAFHGGQWVCDIIYSPIETRFLKKAGLKGAKTLNGLGMLVCQGSESFKIWTGCRFPEDKILGFLKRTVMKG
ncbi:MAG: shikimate dehydrogenase [Nitrospinota bacterium]